MGERYWVRNAAMGYDLFEEDDGGRSRRVAQARRDRDGAPRLEYGTEPVVDRAAAEGVDDGR